MTQQEIIKVWEEKPLPKFNEPKDIPEIPMVNDRAYHDIIIPRIIEAGGIPQKLLIDGATYIGRTRNATEAIWDKGNKKFRYMREKFGNTFEDTCNHFENDNGYALFVPIKLKE